MADCDSDDSGPEPVLHVNLRSLKKKTPTPISPAPPSPDFMLGATPLGPRPKTAPKPASSIMEQGAYTIDPGSKKLAESRERRRRSSMHRASNAGHAPIETTPARQLGALPIPLNKRDTAALKIGRSLINEVSANYDPANSDDPLSHSRFFVDRWLASFETDAKKVRVHGLLETRRISPTHTLCT